MHVKYSSLSPLLPSHTVALVVLGLQYWHRQRYYRRSPYRTDVNRQYERLGFMLFAGTYQSFPSHRQLTRLQWMHLAFAGGRPSLISFMARPRPSVRPVSSNFSPSSFCSAFCFPTSLLSLLYSTSIASLHSSSFSMFVSSRFSFSLYFPSYPPFSLSLSLEFLEMSRVYGR